MALIEGFLKWAMIGIVALMLLSGVVSALFAGAIGVMGDPVFMAVVAVGFLFFVGLICIPLVLVGAWIWRWWRMSAIRTEQAREFIAPDEAGRLPIPVSLLRQTSGAQLAFAQNVASFTSGLTHYHYAPESTQNITGADGQTMSAAATVSPDSFWKLYESGALPHRGFLMGYSLDEGNTPVTADWGDLYSALIGGKSGMGKSTLIRSILAQSALQGGRFVVIDPHYGAGEESLGASLQPLRSLMLCDVASDEKQMVDALFFVGQIGARRLAGQDKDRWPLVLVVDETTALFQRSAVANELTRVLGQIAQETRKVAVYALCIGQNFDGRIIDTTIRNSFVSMISMPARRDVARVQSGSAQFGQMAETLKLGQCVWLTPRGDLYRLTVPNCTVADLEMVARSFDGKNVYIAENGDLQREVPTSQALPSHFHDTSNGLDSSYLKRHFPKAGSAWEVEPEVNTARAQRVINAFLNGDSYTKIASEIYGVTGGRRFTEVREEIDSILRSHMLRLGGNN